jgi:predicted DsbA family dithiol-disulfide isomerase
MDGVCVPICLKVLKMGIRDVPFFYINGEEYKGGTNVNAFSKVIDTLVKQKKAPVKAAAKKRA